MSDFRTNQLKQLNYLDKAISNLQKALKVGEKIEELGYNNGKIAVRAKELLDMYNDQLAVEDNTKDDYFDVKKLDKGVF